MTYKELLNQLSQLTEEQLNQDVCVYDEGADEYYQQGVGVELVYCDVLNLDHPIIRF